MKNPNIKEGECITFNASLPIVKIFNRFLKIEKLHANFKSRINLNQRKFQYIEWKN